MQQRRQTRGSVRRAALTLLAAGTVALAACGDEDGEATEAREPSLDDIELAGSPLVAALARTASDRFSLNTDSEAQTQPATTEAAFAAVCTGRVAAAMTDRQPTDAELARCGDEGVELVELPAGYHAVAVAANPELDLGCLTATSLRRLWREGSAVGAYDDLRPSLPDTPPALFGPDPESPSLALFTAAVLGPETIRDDFEEVADRRVFVTRVSEEPGASGFFNFAEIDSAAPDEVRLVAVAGDDGCVLPSFRSVQTGRYGSLSQPLYIYVSRAALEEPEVSRYMQFLYENYDQAAETTTTLVPLAPDQVQTALRKLPDSPPAPE